MGILFALLLLIVLMQFRDKVPKSASSAVDDQINEVPAAEGNEPVTAFDVWKTPIPKLEWQKPEAVNALTRDPMAIDLTNVDIERAKFRTRTYGDTIGTITLGGVVYHVKGIVFSKEAKSAIIIEDQVLHEGDSILGAVITKILEHSVEFERDGERWIADVGERSQKSQ
jgi:hypothetical protein